MNPDNSSEKKVVIPENDDAQREQFPGYPPYPASEDIMNIENPSERIDADVENFSPAERLGNAAGPTIHNQDPLTQGYSNDKPVSDDEEEDPELKFVAGNDSDVTKEDIENLGDPDQDLDDGDDENISRAKLDPLEGEDELDVPGSDLDDDMEEIGSEDEENNYYSLGSDDNDDLSDDSMDIEGQA